tara:strand:- start:65 stop:271 length:207 start_codon:yes stop_codon:yes gene_type:complete
METLIMGFIMNLYAWNNLDFFYHKQNNERIYKCKWVDIGWQKTDYTNPSLNIAGYIKYRQICINKEKY